MIIKAKNEPYTSWQLEILLDPGSAIKSRRFNRGFRPFSASFKLRESVIYTMVSMEVDTFCVRELETC